VFMFYSACFNDEAVYPGAFVTRRDGMVSNQGLFTGWDLLGSADPLLPPRGSITCPASL